MGNLFLGVDGGQSSTTALIADANGLVLGRGTGGPCNHITGPEARQKFLNAVGHCLRQASAEAGVSFASLRFEAACLGFSGGAEDKVTYARELIESRLWKITHDAEIALAGAIQGRPGIMVIAGTGSMAFGRNANGVTARAGGWGYLFGDEGGALYIVKQALRACLRQEEGWGPPTALTSSLLAATGAATINQLLHDFYGSPRSEIAAFAHLVDEAASDGDQIAVQVIHDAGRELAGYVAGVHSRLFKRNERPDVSYTGGTFQSSHLLHSYESEVERTLEVSVTAPLMSPAAGALLEAFRIADSTIRFDEVVTRLSALRIK